MRILGIFLLILAVPVVLFAALIAWAFFQNEVLYPRELARLQVDAEAWNTENWRAGFALLVTVQVSSDETLGARTEITTLTCY